MSPSSKDCPNLMAIRRRSLDSYAKLKNIAARDDSVLADKIAQLIIWFSLKKKDLNEEDKSRLDSSLVEVYGRYGIAFDNRTIVRLASHYATYTPAALPVSDAGLAERHDTKAAGWV